MCRKRLSIPRCRSELIDSARVGAPGQNVIKNLPSLEIIVATCSPGRKLETEYIASILFYLHYEKAKVNGLCQVICCTHARTRANMYACTHAHAHAHNSNKVFEQKEDIAMTITQSNVLVKANNFNLENFSNVW